MRAFLVCSLLLTLLWSSAYAESEVCRIPGHPMADATGYVLTLGEDYTGIREGVLTGMESPYPYQAGWPADVSETAGPEGALLVQADGDPELEVLFSTDLTVHLMEHDGGYLPGWPVTVTSGNTISGQPSFGDLDGDGTGEVVVASHNYPNGNTGWTWAYGADGTLVEGFPLVTGGDHTKSPTVADLEGDGSCEIIVGERDYPIGRVYVCDGSAELLAGWPQEMDHVPASSAGAADVDGDGVREVFFESYNSLYGFEADGSVMAGFPFTPSTGDVFSYSAPVFADIDGDGDLEIAVGGHAMSGLSHMFLLHHDGSVCAGWPKSVSYWIYGPGTFADLDGDDDLEVLAGDQVLAGSPSNYMYAWHHDGTDVSGWPVGPIDAVNAQAAVADLDGDDAPEVVWDTNITPGKLMGYNHDGTAMEDWPITTDGSTFFNTVAFGDADVDGDLELLLLTQLSTPLCTVHMWDIPDSAEAAQLQMPMFQYGPGRAGEMSDEGQQGVGDGPAGGRRTVVRAAPNPFSGRVSVSVAGANAPSVLRVYDLGGRVVAELSAAASEEGAVFSWDGTSSAGRSMPAGVYAVAVPCGDGVARTLLLKLQ